MLIGFTVSNFKSYKSPQKISMMASRIVRHGDHVETYGGKKILRSGLVFGANASGKSNLLQAVDFSRMIIMDGLESVNLIKKHFRIDSSMYRQPGVFEYRIQLDDKEYSYGIAISYKNREIVGEWLSRIKGTEKERCIFSRYINDEGISCVESDINLEDEKEEAKMKFYFEGFSENISDTYKKKTLLSDVALRENNATGVFSEMVKVYEWFKNIIILFPDTKYCRINEDAADKAKNQMFCKIMKYLDTGIEDIFSVQQEMDFKKVLSGMPPEDAKKIELEILNKLDSHHLRIAINGQYYELYKEEDGTIKYNKILLDHGNQDDIFEFMDESDGTQRLFDLIPLFCKEGQASLVLIDEIDRSLHANLTRRFLELFYTYNQGTKAQIIATTHDSNILDLNLLRQDEIWFVERQEDHSSKVFSLNKFKERFDKKIDKEYLLGRYGAIPIFDEEFNKVRCDTTN